MMKMQVGTWFVHALGEQLACRRKSVGTVGLLPCPKWCASPSFAAPQPCQHLCGSWEEIKAGGELLQHVLCMFLGAAGLQGEICRHWWAVALF